MLRPSQVENENAAIVDEMENCLGKARQISCEHNVDDEWREAGLGFLSCASDADSYGHTPLESTSCLDKASSSKQSTTDELEILTQTPGSLSKADVDSK